MKTPLISIVYFMIAAAVGAIGQYLYKTGADKPQGGMLSYLTNLHLLGGVACYIAVMVLFIGAFKKGGSLTVLYPVYASTFIWGAVIAWMAYGTPIKPIHIGGMVLLIAGMYLMGK